MIGVKGIAGINITFEFLKRFLGGMQVWNNSLDFEKMNPCKAL